MFYCSASFYTILSLFVQQMQNMQIFNQLCMMFVFSESSFNPKASAVEMVCVSHKTIYCEQHRNASFLYLQKLPSICFSYHLSYTGESGAYPWELRCQPIARKAQSCTCSHTLRTIWKYHKAYNACLWTGEGNQSTWRKPEA